MSVADNTSNKVAELHRSDMFFTFRSYGAFEIQINIVLLICRSAGAKK